MKKITMPLDQFSFIWNLISLSWVKQKPNDAKQLAKSIYDKNISFSSEIESLVVEYSVSANEDSLNKLAFLATQNFGYVTEERIQLVALLVSKKLLNARSAVALLASSPKPEKKLSTAGQHVIDVVWLLIQDEKDGIMQVEQDSLLLDALAPLNGSEPCRPG